MAALNQGVFDIQALESWNTVSLDHFKLADTVAPQPTHLVISPGATARYILLSRGSHQICHIGLKVWANYALSFNDPSGKTKCRFSTLEEETYFKEKKELPTATLCTGGQDHSALFQSTWHPIQITVVPGVIRTAFEHLEPIRIAFIISAAHCEMS